jgi:hypothetical protein
MTQYVANAEVWPVPSPYGGNVLTLRNILGGNLLDLSPVVSMLAGAGLFFLGLAVSEVPMRFVLGRTQGVLAWAGIGSGVLVMLLGIYVSIWHGGMLGNRYLYYLARRELVGRKDRLVEPSDPEAVFVEVVPRRNWGRSMLETATDVGFLWIDEQAGEILFEGDRERYRIPANALLDSRIETTPLIAGLPWFFPIFMIVMRVQGAAGTREVPVATRGRWGLNSPKKRHLDAIELENRILRLCPRRSSLTNEGRNA